MPTPPTPTEFPDTTEEEYLHKMKAFFQAKEIEVPVERDVKPYPLEDNTQLIKLWRKEAIGNIPKFSLGGEATLSYESLMAFALPVKDFCTGIPGVLSISPMEQYSILKLKLDGQRVKDEFSKEFKMENIIKFNFEKWQTWFFKSNLPPGDSKEAVKFYLQFQQKLGEDIDTMYARFSMLIPRLPVLYSSEDLKSSRFWDALSTGYLEKLATSARPNFLPGVM